MSAFLHAQHLVAAPDPRSARISGTLRVCAGAAILMGIVTAEALLRAKPKPKAR